jgi:hypothetical protein
MRVRSLVPLALLGCGALTFTVENDSTTTIAGAGLLGELLGALEFAGLDDFDVEIEREMADQGVAEGDLERVTLTDLELAADPDLSFIESIEVWVSGEGVDEVLVASGDSFPEGEPLVALQTTGANLRDVVVAGGMRFRVAASGMAPEDDTRLDIHVEIEVEATAQGACNAAQR